MINFYIRKIILSDALKIKNISLLVSKYYVNYICYQKNMYARKIGAFDVIATIKIKN